MQAVYVLIDWFLPAYKAGGPIQSLASQVAQKAEDLHYKILCSNKDLDGQPLAVETDRWLSFNPWTEVRYSTKGINNAELVDKTSILFVNGIYSWHYNVKPLLQSGAKRKIVSARGMLHPGALSQKSWKKKLYLHLWRLMGIPKKVEFHATTEDEKKFIQQAFGKKVVVHVAANFPRVFSKQAVVGKVAGELNLVSVALISPMKNHLLVLQALAGLAVKNNQFKQINYSIYGPVKEEGYWRDCLGVINAMPPKIKVTFHGDVVPSAVEDVLKEAHVFILPSRSENFGHALYEALSAGKPVITSHGTPWNNLEAARAGMNVDPENRDELAAAILYFAMMETPELEDWSTGAKAYSEKAININEIKEQYRQMFGLEK